MIALQMDAEDILAWQQRGINARILGQTAADNPALPHITKAGIRPDRDNWRQMAEAWLFGWSIEDAIRA